MTLPDSFWAKTSDSDCILWSGAQNSRGYGCFAVNGVSQLAHRLAWEDVNGPIPEGLTIDHLCRIKPCVNVEHMEVVTLAENNRRKRRLVIGGECMKGHKILTDAELYHRKDKPGVVECRQCRNSKPHRSAAA